LFGYLRATTALAGGTDMTLSTILLFGGLWILASGVIGWLLGGWLGGLVERYYPEVDE
jgi:hypothetical protein